MDKQLFKYNKKLKSLKLKVQSIKVKTESSYTLKVKPKSVKFFQIPDKSFRVLID